MTKASKQYRNRNLSRVRGVERSYNLTHKYDLTLAAYDDLVAQQGGVCAVCLKPETAKDNKNGVVRRLSVDHDHVSGKVRGLLCAKCNAGLGHFDDQPTLLESAAHYLRNQR